VPRPSGYEITIEQIVSELEPARQVAAKAWASSAWGAWSQHHEVIRGWLAIGAGEGKKPPWRRIS
jgi:hypothetical protein